MPETKPKHMNNVNHVLFIDDDPIFTGISKSLAKRAGAPEVSICTDVPGALDELHTRVRVDYEEFPDVIFLDLNMPEMDGWEFLEEFRKFPEWSLKKCQVYILSSSADHYDIERSRSYEMVRDFITKPLTADKLQSLWSSGERATA
jgi:CheY-like chemotaxis protein